MKSYEDGFKNVVSGHTYDEKFNRTKVSNSRARDAITFDIGPMWGTPLGYSSEVSS